MYTTTGRQLFALKYAKEGEESKEMWRMDSVARDIVRSSSFVPLSVSL